MKHFLPEYLMSPTHPITISVIGCGGTGAYVVTQLAKIAISLRELKDIDLHVVVYDYDKVEQHNVGRQLFSYADVGKYKSDVIVERVNRFYGLQWISKREKVNKSLESNIVITCTDNLSSRTVQGTTIMSSRWPNHKTQYYWLDFGNSTNYGQFILATKQEIIQPHDNLTVRSLPGIFDLFDEIKEDPEEPSCSMHESLQKQDLFINLQLATAGISLLWKLLNNHFITYHGQFLNLETGQTRPINI
jgi:PRTRC genetic system ThiF family protein